MSNQIFTLVLGNDEYKWVFHNSFQNPKDFNKRFTEIHETDSGLLTKLMHVKTYKEFNDVKKIISELRQGPILNDPDFIHIRSMKNISPDEWNYMKSFVVVDNSNEKKIMIEFQEKLEFMKCLKNFHIR